MNSTVQSQVEAGVIVGVILLVGGWMIRRIIKAMSNDIKDTVISALTVVIDQKVTEKTKPILDQFANNGGKTLKDGQDRLEKAIAKTSSDINQVKEMTQASAKTLGEHIAYHKGQESKPVPRVRKAAAR